MPGWLAIPRDWLASLGDITRFWAMGYPSTGRLFKFVGLVTLLLSPAATADARVERVPISFEVENVNRSALPCQANGATYSLRGEMIGPRKLVTRPAAGRLATVYLHEFSFGQWVWSFRADPTYDYGLAQAKDGHVSIVIDRLGYDASPHPPGTETCLGAHADMARQIVSHLRAGRYSAARSAPIAFDRVLVAGHSVGAGIAELAAYSFPDMGIGGLLVFAWADQGFSQRAIQFSAEQGVVCAGGGEPAEPGEPSGYAYYEQRPEDFQSTSFHSAEPHVVAEAIALRNRDPCGDVASLAQTVALNASRVSEIDVPILLLFGQSDAVFEPGTAEQQRDAYSGSPDVTLEEFPETGHALTLELAAPQAQDTVAGWLDSRGLSSTRAGCASGLPVLRGTSQGDELVGTAEGEALVGRSGVDSLRGNRGDDCLLGGKGDDAVAGGSGADLLSGGGGSDRLLARDGKRDVVRCGRGERDIAVVDRRDRTKGCELARVGI